MGKKELAHNDFGQNAWSGSTDLAPSNNEWCIKKAGEPPVCAAPDEIQPTIIGVPFSIDIVASDPDGWITGIEAINLPMWATLSIITELPAADAVAQISGMPVQKHEGLHVISIVATDNDGNQAVSPLKIKVTDYGFTDEQPGVL